MSAWSLPGRTAATASSDLVPRQLDRPLTAGGWIDPEDFTEAFAYENRHRDFAACRGCGARTREQHGLECPRATILTRPDRFQETQRRDEDRRNL